MHDDLTRLRHEDGYHIRPVELESGILLPEPLQQSRRLSDEPVGDDWFRYAVAERMHRLPYRYWMHIYIPVPGMGWRI